MEIRDKAPAHLEHLYKEVRTTGMVCMTYYEGERIEFYQGNERSPYYVMRRDDIIFGEDSKDVYNRIFDLLRSISAVSGRSYGHGWYHPKFDENVTTALGMCIKHIGECRETSNIDRIFIPLRDNLEKLPKTYPERRYKEILHVLARIQREMEGLEDKKRDLINEAESLLIEENS